MPADLTPADQTESGPPAGVLRIEPDAWDNPALWWYRTPDDDYPKPLLGPEVGDAWPAVVATVEAAAEVATLRAEVERLRSLADLHRRDVSALQQREHAARAALAAFRDDVEKVRDEWSFDPEHYHVSVTQAAILRDLAAVLAKHAPAEGDLA